MNTRVTHAVFKGPPCNVQNLPRITTEAERTWMTLLDLRCKDLKADPTADNVLDFLAELHSFAVAERFLAHARTIFHTIYWHHFKQGKDAELWGVP